MMMKKRIWRTFPLVLLGLALFCGYASGQAPAVERPQQEKLLNGLKLLIWPDATANKVSVTIRVHSGSAFDPQGKEGVMKMLSEAIFPTEDAREYFKNDLGGNLSINCTYDFIQINASSNSDEFLNLFDTLAAAVSNLNADKESTSQLKASLTSQITEAEKSPEYIADQAIATRLFGTFPYGRPILGTKESVAKIDFADLLFAKERFFTADNATVSIRGNVKADLAYRAARRYFGGWLKADKKTPSTFRQADAPKSGMPIFDSPMANRSEFRLAVRGLARNDPDFYAAKILQKVLDNRWKSSEQGSSSVRHDQRTLASAFVFAVSDWNLGKIQKIDNTIKMPLTDGYEQRVLRDNVTTEEFDAVNREWLAKIDPKGIDVLWLDVDTFKLTKPEVELTKAMNVKLEDVQRVLTKLRGQPVAMILVFAGE